MMADMPTALAAESHVDSGLTWKHGLNSTRAWRHDLVELEVADARLAATHKARASWSSADHSQLIKRWFTRHVRAG